ncbi:helix-turn-helix transcriptional regulator [Methanolobus halotolerans]|uniref:Transcriptional regulator n=1 Tax=Methanolobus halotolerans TaxID=2052935 RepID=A0A4E0PW75_9EURY|nr:winged helix-turn-helix domain-containing protein [Methanolobus halotolerans]TGC09524.1 transcriptional regulator [Methanolobus halotolerans]
MKKELLDVIFKSEKRKEILILLQDGSKEMEDILQSLNSSRQALLPQIRILEEHYLVSQEKDTYELTTIGKLIIDEMVPFVNTVDALDVDIDYWGTRRLDFIPPHLIKRISELGKCEVVNPPLNEAYELNKQVVEDCYKSKSVFIISTFFHPMYPTLFSKLIENNVNVYAIFSQDVVNLIRSNYYADYLELRAQNLVHLFMYTKKMNLQAVVCNDHCLLMRLLKSNDGVDNKHVVCFNPCALEWGKEVFDCYMKNSTPITEL